jgi:hypothetical protein
MGSGQHCRENGESLWDFIQRFYNKRNINPEVNDKSIIMLFNKGLRDSSLIRKLTMKNPRTPEEILAIANMYALVEEATIDTKQQNKDKELGHSDQADTSKSQDKKRKVDCSAANVERPRRIMEYQPMLGELEGFLDRTCIFHPHGKHKTWDCDQLQDFTDEVLKMAKKVDFLEAHKEVNYIYGGSDSYESRRKQNSPSRRSWRSHLPPSST